MITTEIEVMQFPALSHWTQEQCRVPAHVDLRRGLVVLKVSDLVGWGWWGWWIPNKCLKVVVVYCLGNPGVVDLKGVVEYFSSSSRAAVKKG